MTAIREVLENHGTSAVLSVVGAVLSLIGFVAALIAS